MSRLGLCLCLALGAAAPLPAQVWFSELLINLPGGDDGLESVELQSPQADFKFDGWLLIILDGDGSNSGQVDQILDLTLLQAGANGLLLIRDADTVLEPPPDPATSVVIIDLTPDLENGSSTFIVGEGSVAFRVGDDLDADNDGRLDDLAVFSQLAIADAVSFREAGAGQEFEFADQLGGTALGQFAFTPDALYRVLNCNDGTPWSWAGGDVAGTAPGPFTWVSGATFGWSSVEVDDPSGRTLDPGSLNFCYTPCPCIGDLDGDCRTGFEDLLVLLTQFDQSGSADFNSDGTVDFLDLVTFLADYGCTRP